MKAQIRKQIAAGRTKDQIENYFVAELGPQVLAVPRSSGFDLLAWLLPFGAILFGAGAVGVGARAWLRERDGPDDGEAALPEEPRLAPGLEARVDQALARFDS
jgi:cytochrome c-type biogenesis protein CcmH